MIYKSNQGSFISGMEWTPVGAYFGTLITQFLN